MTQPKQMPEREMRAIPADVARAAIGEDGNTLVGYGAVTGTWTDIEGWNGAFKEQIAPGAFKRTIANNGNRVKVMFNHGMDPTIGQKPLGKPSVLEERTKGLWLEVPLDETSYNQDLKASLRSGSIDGMSFAFDVLDEDWNEERTERTIKEVRLYEVGPVTWPAYETTTVGIRSKGVYGMELAAPSESARRKAPASDARDTSAQEARNLRMAEKIRASEESREEVAKA